MGTKTPGREIFAKYTDAETFEKIKEFGSISEMWKNCIEKYSDEEAIFDLDTSFSFAKTEEMAAGFRTVIKKNIEGTGKRIGIYAVNSFEFVKAFIAITTMGHTAVILPAQLDENTVFGCCYKFALDAVVYHEDLKQKAAVAAEKLRGKVKFISVNENDDEKTELSEVSKETPCVVMFTGGTTGKSKGALLTNGAVMQGVVNGCFGYKDVFGQKYILVLPLSHVFGLIRNLLTSLYTGSSMMICRNNKDMFRDIAVFKPTILVVVPALVEMALTLSKKFGKNMLGESMKYIICGAATVASYLVTEYEKYGITLCPGYGLTETANLVSGNPESLKKPGSVGIMYPNQQYRVEDGELWLKGENLMTAYIGEDESGFTEDGWFKTGDLVRFDEDGFLYITGRIKEIIVLSNGENVSPAEIETKFNELDFVQDSQVFEDRTSDGKEILALEIVPRMTEIAKLGLSDPNAYMLGKLEEVNAGLPSHMRINKLTIRDKDFERTPSMKILRYKKVWE